MARELLTKKLRSDFASESITSHPVTGTSLNKPNFHVKIDRYETIREIGGAWTQNDYQQMLAEMDCATDDNSSEAELRELCLMCLQDRPNVEAAEIVLKHRLDGNLTAGQIKNAALELADEKLWEQFADLSRHEELFHAGSLMFAAFPDVYYEPDAIRLTVEIVSKNTPAAELMAKPFEESLLVRILAGGMSDNSILHRLFDEQLAGTSFPEASSIVWIFDLKKTADDKISGTITSSAHWLDSLLGVEEYESHAHPDAIT